MSFVHRFGSVLNANLHFHCCSAEAEETRFHQAVALTDGDITAVQREVRMRVLRLYEASIPGMAGDFLLLRGCAFKCRGLLSAEERRPGCTSGDMAVGFPWMSPYASRPATRRDWNACSAIAPPDSAAKRLVWARPGQRLSYQRPNPRPDGQTTLALTLLELLDRLVVLAPARTSCPGVLRAAWVHWTHSRGSPRPRAVTGIGIKVCSRLMPLCVRR